MKTTADSSVTSSKKLMIFIIGLLWFSIYVLYAYSQPYCEDWVSIIRQWERF
jgi:hypothetical protein